MDVKYSKIFFGAVNTVAIVLDRVVNDSFETLRSATREYFKDKLGCSLDDITTLRGRLAWPFLSLLSLPFIACINIITNALRFFSAIPLSLAAVAGLVIDIAIYSVSKGGTDLYEHGENVAAAAAVNSNDNNGCDLKSERRARASTNDWYYAGLEFMGSGDDNNRTVGPT